MTTATVSSASASATQAVDGGSTGSGDAGGEGTASMSNAERIGSALTYPLVAGGISAIVLLL